MAAWLGWQIESNWADPFLFAIYSIIKPISSAAILVVMYSVITGGNFDSPVFPYIYLGNAFYIYVAAILVGMSWTIIDDREHYRTMKYIYTAPVSFPVYLLGRSVAKFLIGSLSVFITLLFGVVFLKVPLVLSQVNWPLFLAGLLTGLIMLTMIGYLIAGLTMVTARHYGAIGESAAGALYLFSGAIFPLDVLPAWLRPVGYAMPLTYWLEVIRRALIGEVAEAFPTLSGFTDSQLLLILVGLSILFGILSFFIFRICEHSARERGLIDEVTNY